LANPAENKQFLLPVSHAVPRGKGCDHVQNQIARLRRERAGHQVPQRGAARPLRFATIADAEFLVAFAD
jgi:hypothetical protein